MKRTFKRIFFVVIFALLIFLGYWLKEMYQFAGGVKEDAKRMEAFWLAKEIQNGDIIFQTSKSNQSKAIQLATHSKYSHLGIIYENNGEFFVYEAVQPVKLTPLADWINRGENKHYVVKRLEHADRLLNKETLAKMREIGEKFNGKDYDIYFEWSNDRIYCSELVWKIYKEALDIEIGKLEKLSDFDLSHESVKKIMKQRYGENIPSDEIVISPASMFESDKLILVKRN